MQHPLLLNCADVQRRDSQAGRILSEHVVGFLDQDLKAQPLQGASFVKRLGVRMKRLASVRPQGNRSAVDPPERADDCIVRLRLLPSPPVRRRAGMALKTAATDETPRR